MTSNERFTALPTAEEYALFREAYAETYPVRPLLNAIDAKDAEIERLRAQVKALQTYPPMLFDPETGTLTPLRTADETS